MASSGKKKTTMAKLSRESRLRERRVEKKARKDARKLAAANPDQTDELSPDEFTGEGDEPDGADELVSPAGRDERPGDERELAVPPAAGTSE